MSSPSAKSTRANGVRKPHTGSHETVAARANNSAAKGKVVTKTPAAKKSEPLDLSMFPAESVTQENRRVCLACVLDVLTRQLGLTVRTAHTQIKRYVPSLEELRERVLSRPFLPGDDDEPCPYCGSIVKWHARLPEHVNSGGIRGIQPRR
jgi:hypothetical protein